MITPAIHTSVAPVWISNCKAYSQKPAARDIEDGYYNELIEEQINVEKQAVYNHSIIQIVSQSGVQNASEISVNFNPAYERVDFHSIVVWRNNKPQSRLNINAFKILADESDFDRFIYNGTFVAKYILPDIRKGDRIEYSYTVTGSNPIFDNKFARTVYFQAYSIIAHQYTSILVSENRKLNIKPINNVPKVVITTLACGLKRYEWESFQAKPVRSSNNRQPGWYNAYSRIQVSDYTNWAEVVNWAMKINPVTTAFTGELALAIVKLKKDAGNDKEKYFRNAVKLVQDEVRYMGIETGQYSHKANDPGKVYRQRYGDCKDKSLLLASILRAGGIDASMALINTYLRDKIDDFLPSATLFNHAVVVATINGKQVWVDATISYQRGNGTAIYFPDYIRGLILKPGNNALTNIPLTESGKTTCTETYTVPNEKDSVDLRVKTVYTFGDADETRSRLASSSMSETEKTYLDYYAKIYPNIEVKDSITIIDDEQKNILTTIEHYRIAKYLKLDTTDEKYHGNFYANIIDERLPKINGQFKTPVAVNFPYNVDYTVNLVFPSTWKINETKYSIARTDYRFYLDKYANGDTLTMHYQFAYLNSFIPVSRLSQFAADVKELSDVKLALNFFYTPPGKITTSKVNYFMVVLAVVAVIVCTLIALMIYRKRTTSVRLSGYSYGRMLGGWLILIIIGMFATVISVGNYVVTGSYFKTSTWHAYDGLDKTILFKILLPFELVCNIFTVCYAAFCFMLLINKRDITSKYVQGFYIYNFVFILIDHALMYYLDGSSSMSTTVLRMLLMVGIWVPYFRMSERVKETFIEPFPAGNIIYEQTEEFIETTPDENVL